MRGLSFAKIIDRMREDAEKLEQALLDEVRRPPFSFAHQTELLAEVQAIRIAMAIIERIEQHEEPPEYMRPQEPAPGISRIQQALDGEDASAEG